MVDMIQINDLKFSYPDGSAALRGVSLSVKPGEFVTLCGLSGCGKSTLLRLMKPGLFPRGELSGDVRFLGRKLTSEPEVRSSSSAWLRRRCSTRSCCFWTSQRLSSTR